MLQIKVLKNIDVKKITNEFLERNVINILLSAIEKIGIQCVNEARVNGSYTDRTGNLRSSVGYVILYNGDVVSRGGCTPVAVAPKTIKEVRTSERKLKNGETKTYTYTVNVKVEGDGKEGAKSGEEFQNELITHYSGSKGIVLIVSAGMKYGVYVEAKGFNVITSAKLLAEKITPETLRKLGFEIKN